MLRFVDDPPTVTDLLAIAHTARLGEPASRMAWLLLWSLAHEGKDMSMQRVRGSMLVAVAMAATLSTACEKPVAVAPQAPEVYVTTVVQKDVPVYLDLVGQTQGFQDVDIRARVEGFLNTVNFREGSFAQRRPSIRSTRSRSSHCAGERRIGNEPPGWRADNDVARMCRWSQTGSVSGA